MTDFANDNASPVPSPAEIAERIRAGCHRRRRLPCSRPDLELLANLTSVREEATYELLASVRRNLASWRGADSRQLKDDIDTLLTLYRVERWSEMGVDPEAGATSGA